METTYIVGVGGVSAGTEQRGERRTQLHGAGLLWTTRDPVWVGVWDHTLLDQLADTWGGEDRETFSVRFHAEGNQVTAVTFCVRVMGNAVIRPHLRGSVRVSIHGTKIVTDIPRFPHFYNTS